MNKVVFQQNHQAGALEWSGTKRKQRPDTQGSTSPWRSQGVDRRPQNRLDGREGEV